MSNKLDSHFPWYPQQYLSSLETAQLSLAEEGAYIRALSYCWINGSIPSDPKELAKIIGKRCTVTTADRIQKLFVLDKQLQSSMTSIMLDHERRKHKIISEKQQKNVNKRWSKSIPRCNSGIDLVLPDISYQSDHDHTDHDLSKIPDLDYRNPTVHSVAKYIALHHQLSWPQCISEAEKMLKRTNTISGGYINKWISGMNKKNHQASISEPIKSVDDLLKQREG